MRRMLVGLILGFVSAFPGCAGPFLPFDLDAQVEGQRTFIWRGLRMHTSSSADVSLAVQNDDFRLVGWADVDRGNRRPFEMDMALEARHCSFSWGAIEGGVSRMAHRYQRLRHEAYVTFLPENTWFPSVSTFVDLSDGGVYLLAWMGHTFDLHGYHGLSLEGGLGAVHRNPKLGLDLSGRSFTGVHDTYLKADLWLPWPERVECHLFTEIHLPLGTRSRHCLETLNQGEASLWNAGIRFRLFRSRY